MQAIEQSIGALFTCQCKRKVIAPVPRDVQECGSQPFLAEPELFDNASTCGVLRSDVDLHAMQPDGPETVINDQRHCRRHDAVTGDALVDPIAEAR